MDVLQVCNGLASRLYGCVAGEEAPESLLADVTETLGFEVGAIASVYHGSRGDESFCHMASGIDLETCRRAERAFNISGSTTLRDGSPMSQGLLQDRDSLISMERLRQEAFYEEFSLPNRATEGAKMLLFQSPEQSLFMNVARPMSGFDQRRRAEALEILAPHMLRCARLHLQLDQTHVLRRLCWESANLCPYPMVVFDNDGQQFLANRLAELLVGDGLALSASGLQAELLAEHRMLQRCIQRVVAFSEGDLPLPRDNEVLVSRPSGKRPYRVVVVPLMADKQRMGRRPAAAALVFDQEDTREVSIERCGEVFGLTRSEAEVAIGIMRGQSPEQISAAQGRSAATVRNLLKRVFIKTGVNRQSELTRLMMLSPVVSHGLPTIPDGRWDPFRGAKTN